MSHLKDVDIEELLKELDSRFPIKFVIGIGKGDFIISKKAVEWLNDKGNDYHEHSFEYDRTNPDLIKCVEELGEESYGKNKNGEIFKLKVDKIDFDAFMYYYRKRFIIDLTNFGINH